MRRIKRIFTNVYNRYMDEMDDYEELEEEYVESDLEDEEEYRAKRAEKERRSQLDEAYLEDDREEIAGAIRVGMSREQYQGNVKANIYDYTREVKVCCHCESSLEKGISSEKDQWEMSYVICPSCQFVNRIQPNGTPVVPSSEQAEMEHALQLFAQNGYVFPGFNKQGNSEESQIVSL